MDNFGCGAHLMPGANFQALIASLVSSSSPPTVSYLTASLSTTDTSSPSFASISLGDDTKTRIIVVGWGSLDTGANSVSSATIAGISATVVANANGSGGGTIPCAGMFYAVVPASTGSTGTIAITLADSAFRNHIGVWAIYGYTTAAPYYNSTSTADPLSKTTTPTSGSVGIANCCNYNGAGATFSWTNLTENYDASGEAANEQYSGASAQSLAASSTNFVGDASGSEAGAGVIALWR